MTLALWEEGFRNFRTRVVHSHLQLPGTHDHESSIVPYLANLVICKKRSFSPETTFYFTEQHLSR
jgi:hypothetical protein